MDAEGCESTFLGARRSWRLKSQGVSLLSYSKRQPHTRHHRTPIPIENAKSDPSPGSPARILAYILLWSPHTRTKNSTFACETDGSDQKPDSESFRIAFGADPAISPDPIPGWDLRGRMGSPGSADGIPAYILKWSPPYPDQKFNFCMRDGRF